jgi:hypothetical protein
MRLLTAIVVMGLTLVGCSPAPQDFATTATTAAETTTTRAPSNEICLSGDLPFRDEGLVAALGEDEGDATTVSQIRWDPSGTCERLTVIFGTDSGAPATTLGPSAVSVISYAGIVRAELPAEVDTSAVADTLIEGSLVHSVFVVRDQNGIVFIDIQGVDGIPIQARAFTTKSPATLVMDIARADTPATPVGVTTTGSAVVIAPTPGRMQYPAIVSGYVEPGMLAVRVQLLESDNAVVDRSVSVHGYTDTWQSFTSTIDDGPSGDVVLFVGTLDSNKNPLNGAFVSITVE